MAAVTVVAADLAEDTDFRVVAATLAVAASVAMALAVADTASPVATDSPAGSVDMGSNTDEDLDSEVITSAEVSASVSTARPTTDTATVIRDIAVDIMTHTDIGSQVVTDGEATTEDPKF